MSFLLYDVETPNHFNDSICACAWMLHDGVNAIDFGYQLINPQADFDSMNVSIHHITSDDVADSPTFGEYWNNTLSHLFSDATIIAHNARFDLSVTEKALNSAGIVVPDIDYVDSLKLFRSLFPGQSCKLCDLAAKYGYFYNSHDAGEDVKALCVVLDNVRSEKGFSDYGSLFDSVKKHEAPRTAVPQTYAEYVAMVNRFFSEIKAKNIDLSEIHFAFHGEMQDPPIYRRNGLDKIIEALGGTFHRHACKKIDYYVCFNSDVTGTVEQARALATVPENHIEIIDTAAFFKLLGYHTEPNRDGPNEIRLRKHREREVKEAIQREKELKKARRTEAKPKKAEPKPRLPQGRVVRQLDRDGNLIQVFPSITIAAASVGTNTKSISDVLCGKQKTAGGFRWESIDKEGL